LAIIADDERLAPADGVPTPRLMREPTPQPTPREPKPVWRPHVGFVTTVGVLESIAFGPAIGLGLEYNRIVVGLEGWWLPARTFQLEPGEADVALLAATAMGCWRTAAPDDDPMWVAVCGQLSGGRLSGSGAGFSHNKEAHRPWFAPGLGAVGGVRLVGPLEAFGSAKLMIPVHRESFVVRNLGEAHETPPIGLQILTGVSVRIE
jgi:hypothetical protein